MLIILLLILQRPKATAHHQNQNFIISLGAGRPRTHTTLKQNFKSQNSGTNPNILPKISNPKILERIELI